MAVVYSIIDRVADKVIGIATMSITYRFNSANSGLTLETRWFGYQVDNIDPDKGWVKIDRDSGMKASRFECGGLVQIPRGRCSPAEPRRMCRMKWFKQPCRYRQMLPWPSSARSRGGC